MITDTQRKLKMSINKGMFKETNLSILWNIVSQSKNAVLTYDLREVIQPLTA